MASDDEVERVFGALSVDGKVEMPLQPTERAEKHGTCADRFGVQWMLSHTGNVRMSLGQERNATATG